MVGIAALILIAAAVVLFGLAIAALSACMLSSQISQQEEGLHRWEQ